MLVELALAAALETTPPQKSFRRTVAEYTLISGLDVLSTEVGFASGKVSEVNILLTDRKVRIGAKLGSAVVFASAEHYFLKHDRTTAARNTRRGYFLYNALIFVWNMLQLRR
jgi:hypothetical protein